MHIQIRILDSSGAFCLFDVVQQRIILSRSRLQKLVCFGRGRHDIKRNQILVYKVGISEHLSQPGLLIFGFGLHRVRGLQLVTYVERAK